MNRMKNPKVSHRFDGWMLSAGEIASFIGAAIILLVVVAGYVERDVLRMRGVVLALMLLGLAMIVRSEARSYVPVPRRNSR